MKVIILIVLDTNTLVKRLRNDKEVTRRLKRFNAAELATTSISVCELYIGAYIGIHDRARKISDVEKLVSRLLILKFDQQSAKESAIIQSRLVERKVIGDNEWLADLLIAGITKRYSAKLITFDEDFEKMKGINVERWLENN